MTGAKSPTMDAAVLLDVDESHALLLAAAAPVMFKGVDGKVVAVPMNRVSGRFHVYRLRVLRRDSDLTRSCFVKVADSRCSQERQTELQQILCHEFVSWSDHVCNEPSFQLMQGELLRTNSSGTTKSLDRGEALGAFDVGDRHCLCYSGVGRAAPEPVPMDEPVPMANLLREPLNAETARLVTRAIHLVHDLQASWRSPNQIKDEVKTPYAIEYEDQLRWELDDGRRGTRQFLERWIGEDGKNQYASLLFELGLACPWDAVMRLKASKEDATLRYRPNHGDLHQRNIMIQLQMSGDQREVHEAYLIDFESTKPRHWVCDWVTLEASLKLFDCAAHFSELEYLALHDALDQEFRLSTVEEHRPGRFLWDILSDIRDLSFKEAESAGITNEAWRQEYYMSSLFVTLGMTSMSGCPARLAYLTAAWMAGHLSDV